MHDELAYWDKGVHCPMITNIDYFESLLTNPAIVLRDTDSISSKANTSMKACSAMIIGARVGS